MAGIKAPKVKTPAQMKAEMAVGRAAAAPTIMTRSDISELAEYIKNREGGYGLRRVERAADEIPRLGELYSQDALREAFSGDNARALMTLKPSEFEKYAIPLEDNLRDESVKNIANLIGIRHKGGFDSVPYFEVNKEEQGLPLLPFISGHEGRHRNRALSAAGEEAGLVQFLPRAELREPFPRRSQEDYIEALKREMSITGNKVLPQVWRESSKNSLEDITIRRPAIDLPDLYAEGGAVKPPAIFEEAQVPFEEIRRQLGMKSGGAVHMQDGGDPQAEIDRMRYELSSRIKPTTDVEEQIKNARLMASPERTSLDAGDALTSPEMYEKNRDLFGVNRKTASQAYTEFGVPMIDASGKSVPFPKTMYDIESDKIEKQLESGIKPDWMSNKDFIQDQAARKGYVTSPKTMGDFGQNAMAALMGSKFLGGTLRALGAVDEAAQGVIGSSYGLDPTMGIIGQTGRLHRVPRGLSTIKEGIVRDVGQFPNDVFNAQRGITQGYPTLGSEFSKAFVTPKPTTYEILSGLEPSMLPSSAAKIFAGSKSKTADIAMRDIAQARLIAGEDPAIVWKETGWTAPPYGGDMRYEIPDTGLSGQKITEAVSKKFNAFGKNKVDLRAAYDIKLGLERGNTMDEILAKLPAPPTEDALKIAMDDKITVSQIASRFNTLAKKPIETAMKTTGKLGSMVEHPEFFAAYPDMENLIRFETLGKKDIKNFRGSFNPYKTELKVSPHLESSRDSVLAHELQHAVQHREGTSPGGSPSGVKNSPQQFDPVTASELQMLQDRIINDTGRLGELHRRREAGTLTALERGELNSLTQALPEHANYIQARKDFLSQGTPQELYKRLAGEAEARLTQYRLGLTPEQRLEQYPYDPAYFKTATGYSIDDIINNIVREGSSISSKSIEPSIPKMKAEPRERVLAPANPQGFYSATEAAALNLQRKSGSGQAFLNDLLKQENVRPDEINAMGLDTFLKGKKDVTAAEVQDFIANNKIQLGETVYGGNLNEQQLMAERDRIAKKIYNYTYDELPKYRQDAVDQNIKPTATKFSQYALLGGENYREVVITMPQNKTAVFPKQAELDAVEKQLAQLKAEGNREEFGKLIGTQTELRNERTKFLQTEQYRLDQEANKNQYRSPHWNDPNALAHLRMSDRVTDGKKTLLVDEVQSDWHQAGREQGYKNDIDMPSMSADELLLEYGDRLSSGQKSDLKDFISRWEKASENNDTDRLDRLFEEYDGWAKRQKLQGVPDAPYKEDWYQLALRRAVKEAIDGGYDRVALPTGARVNERFDLSKHIESISHQKNPDGTYKIVAVDKNNRHAMNEMSVPEEKLSSIVGKDVAQKIINAEGTPFPEGTVGAGMTKLSGLDLKVGGEGNIKYYDEVYPNYLKKFGKKYGANVGMTSVQTEPSTDKIFKDVGKYYAYTGQGRDTKEFNTYAEALKFLGIGAEPLHYMEITPAMREAFKTGIHMKRGGKVSFANNIDAMRLALSKG